MNTHELGCTEEVLQTKLIEKMKEQQESLEKLEHKKFKKRKKVSMKLLVS